MFFDIDYQLFITVDLLTVQFVFILVVVVVHKDCNIYVFLFIKKFGFIFANSFVYNNNYYVHFAKL